VWISYVNIIVTNIAKIKRCWVCDFNLGLDDLVRGLHQTGMTPNFNYRMVDF
jgi:hypothetical protein